MVDGSGYLKTFPKELLKSIRVKTLVVVDVGEDKKSYEFLEKFNEKVKCYFLGEDLPQKGDIKKGIEVLIPQDVLQKIKESLEKHTISISQEKKELTMRDLFEINKKCPKERP